MSVGDTACMNTNEFRCIPSSANPKVFVLTIYDMIDDTSDDDTCDDRKSNIRDGIELGSEEAEVVKYELPKYGNIEPKQVIYHSMVLTGVAYFNTLYNADCVHIPTQGGNLCTLTDFLTTHSTTTYEQSMQMFVFLEAQLQAMERRGITLYGFSTDDVLVVDEGVSFAIASKRHCIPVADCGGGSEGCQMVVTIECPLLFPEHISPILHELVELPARLDGLAISRQALACLVCKCYSGKKVAFESTKRGVKVAQSNFRILRGTPLGMALMDCFQ